MNDRGHIIGQIRKVANALWIKSAAENIILLAFYFSLTLAGIIILVKLGLSLLHIWNYLLVLGIGLVTGLASGRSRRPSLYETAVFLDNALLLKSRLATGLECLLKDNPNPIERLLVDEITVLQSAIRPRLAYQRFNMNYLFQFILSLLGITILWLIPGIPSEARESFHNVLTTQSTKLTTTAESVKQVDLDGLSRTLVNEMERLAEAINQDKRPPAEILAELEKIRRQAEEELHKTNAGEKLYQEIALLFNQSSGSAGIPDSDEVKKLMREIEESVRSGRVKLDIMNQLKEVLQEALNNIPQEQSLQEALKSVDNPDISLNESLSKFFQEISEKNRRVMERILTRVQITEREISEAVTKYQPETPLTAPETVTPTAFSLVNTLQTPSIQPPAILWEPPPTPERPEETNRAELLKEVIQARMRAMEKPDWSPKYDEIIRAYFRE